MDLMVLVVQSTLKLLMIMLLKNIRVNMLLRIQRLQKNISKKGIHSLTLLQKQMKSVHYMI